MKRIIYEDDSGVVHCSLLRDIDDENHPEIGVPINPPPIERIIVENALEVRNQLVRMGILTYKDLLSQPNSVSNIIDRVIRKKLVEAYKLEESKQNG